MGPLAGLPSLPGPHIAQIEAMGEGEWLNIGPPAADPTWGSARGRAWAGTLSYAPDLQGAFFTGAGQHAYVTPEGRFMDDIWFYDLNAHRWIAIYPGLEVATLAQRIRDGEFTVPDETGLLTAADGQPLPAYMTHAWRMTEYDSLRHEFASFGGSQVGDYFSTSEGGFMNEAYRLYQDLRGDRVFPPLSPQLYQCTTGRFDRYPVEIAAPAGEFRGLNINWVVLYVPSIGQYFAGGAAGVRFFDPETRQWTNAQPEGEGPPDSYDNGACYDSLGHRIYYGLSSVLYDYPPENEFFVYDIETHAWSRVGAVGSAPPIMGGTSTFYHDSIHDVVVVIQSNGTGPNTRGVYVYHPDTNRWDPPQPFPDDIPNGRANSGFFVPGLNATFFFSAGDSAAGGTMWVYRYRR